MTEWVKCIQICNRNLCRIVTASLTISIHYASAHISVMRFSSITNTFTIPVQPKRRYAIKGRGDNGGASRSKVLFIFNVAEAAEGVVLAFRKWEEKERAHREHISHTSIGKISWMWRRVPPLYAHTCTQPRRGGYRKSTDDLMPLIVLSVRKLPPQEPSDTR